MTDHTDEEQLKLIQSIDPSAVRVPPGVSKIIEHFDALRQQDLARIARMREALNNCRALLEMHGWHTCANDTPEFQTWNEEKAALSETSDIQEWMDGQRADAFDDAAKECREWESATKVLGICDRAEYQRLAYINVATVFSDMAAELRARSTKGEG